MAPAGPILLEGGGRLAAAIAQRLEEAGAQVERVTIPEHSHAGAAAHLAHAAVLVLATDDDAGNVDLALWARQVRPDLPLVARIFDESLADYLAGRVERLTVLSMSQVAAPVFAAAALRALEAERGTTGPAARRRRARRRWPDRVLLGALAGLVLVVGPATVFFAHALDLRPIDALYFVWTTVMTVGYGDISLGRSSDAAKLVGMLLMLAGAAFVATLFAFLTGWVVTRRLDVLHGRVRVRGQGHTVVAGAGNLGFRVATLLAEQKRRVVIIERDEDSRNLAALRADGHHVIVADATNEQVLELAGVDRAGTILLLTDSDAVNLQIALLLRARGTPAPVVMKMFSPQLSAHVTKSSDLVALSPIAVAAQAFVDAALARERP
jgi:Trk K+ transport system NAD-binding subunit/multidrug transporter EmrE-like cation transporter